MNVKRVNSNKKKANSNLNSKISSSSEFLTVPSFLLKTYEIVNDESLDDIVRWNNAGDAFIIWKTHEFCEEVLPLYFKHKNLSSFVRQLNMYGFHKTKHKNNEHCFIHKYFMRDNKNLLLQMKRKIKEDSSDKKSQSNEANAKDSDAIKMIKSLQNKMKEQDKKIAQLFNANNEFKNSVMTLYIEIEKAKEREKMVEKMIESNQNNTKLEMTSTDKKITMDYNYFLKMFSNAADNFSQGHSHQPINKNLFYINNDNLNGLRQNYADSSNKMYQYGNNSHSKNGNVMIENGSLPYVKEFYNAKEEIKEGWKARRNSNVMRSPSPSYPDAWKKVHGINSRPGSPRTLLK